MTRKLNRSENPGVESLAGYRRGFLEQRTQALSRPNTGQCPAGRCATTCTWTYEVHVNGFLLRAIRRGNHDASRVTLVRNRPTGERSVK